MESINTGATFKEAVDFVLRKEGGYTMSDGIETNFGITKRSYPHLDIAGLTKNVAADIYYMDYWIVLQCDALPRPLNFVLFDTAVNCGRERAVKWIQEELNITMDGVVGAETISACINTPVQNLLLYLLYRRQLHYLGLRKKFPGFFAGWIGRVTDLMRSISQGDTNGIYDVNVR